MSAEPGNENDEGQTPKAADDDARPLTGEPVAPMRLRPEPPRVTRLSRKVLAGLGLAASLGVGGALIYALQTRHGGNPGQELYSTDNRTTPDGLAGLPKDYSGVPRLGPPLPGDLGRPILNAQNAGQPVPTPGIATPNAGPVGPTPEEQRRAQELEAARTAKLFASTETRPASTGSAAPPSASVTPPTDLTSLGLAPQPTTPSAQQRQQAFLDAVPDKRTVSPDRVAAPASKNVLQAGAVIAAALITGIRSDLPGQITAQVTENVYDSPTGRILLVPQGTRVVGQYDMLRLIPWRRRPGIQPRTTENSMYAERHHTRRGRPRRPAPQTLPDDLYDYDDDPLPAERRQHRAASPHAVDVEALPVIDDWPERVPVTTAEIDIFERHFGDVLDRLCGPIDDPEAGGNGLLSLTPDGNQTP